MKHVSLPGRKSLKYAPNISSVFEFGTNIGANLEAIRHVAPNVTINGIEINPLAVRICRERGFDNVNQDSIVSYKSQKQYDLVFSRGVLIHITPQHLKTVLTTMYDSSCRYILIWENFSSKPYHLEKYSNKVKDSYRLKDSEGFQFWMDFAGEFAKLYTGIKVVAKSKNSSNAKHGELVWTLFEK